MDINFDINSIMCHEILIMGSWLYACQIFHIANSWSPQLCTGLNYILDYPFEGRPQL
jgi:hypothetical protein